MFTPAISASSTSPPPVIWVNAFSTQVTVPPFLYQLPFMDAMTTGSAAAERRTAGASSARGSGAAADQARGRAPLQELPPGHRHQ